MTTQLKYILLFFLTVSFSLFAKGIDSLKIDFSKTSIDFNSVYEADGDLSVEFPYTNSGILPVRINRIIAPGFKKVSYQKEIIKPGKSGKITATIAPLGRSGHFNKEIIVFTNTPASPETLVVEGKIIKGSEKTSFKYRINELVFKQSQINFGYVYKGDINTEFIPVRNSSDHTISLEYINNNPHISVTNNFTSLAPGETGLIDFTYYTDSINDWDFVFDDIQLVINNTPVDKEQLRVTANIRENFNTLSKEEKSVLPKADLPIKVFNFDTIPVGKKIIHDYPVYNKGDRELIIRAVKPTCGCTAAIPEKTIISPGDSTNIRVEFDSRGFQGLNKKGVTVITNDPYHYKDFLWITGFVE